MPKFYVVQSLNSTLNYPSTEFKSDVWTQERHRCEPKANQQPWCISGGFLIGAADEQQ